MRHRGRQVGWNVRALVSCPLPPMHDVGAEAATNSLVMGGGLVGALQAISDIQ
jgi:hypothetical protein